MRVGWSILVLLEETRSRAIGSKVRTRFTVRGLSSCCDAGLGDELTSRLVVSTSSPLGGIVSLAVVYSCSVEAGTTSCPGLQVLS